MSIEETEETTESARGAARVDTDANEARTSRSIIFENCHFYHNPTTATAYDLEVNSGEDRAPIFVLSESEENDGLSFNDWQVRDGIAKDAAQAAGEMYGLTPDKLNLFQQRPDGNFDHVRFRRIGEDGQSEADVERQQAEPEWRSDQQPLPVPEEPEKPVQWEEYQRSQCTRANLEKLMEKEPYAPAEPYVQDPDPLRDEWRRFTGPPAEPFSYGPRTEQEASQEQTPQDSQPAEPAEPVQPVPASQEPQQRTREQNEQLHQHVQRPRSPEDHGFDL